MRRAPHIAWVGAQRNVLAGDLRAVVSLAELRRFEHLYALGPLEGLRGEISVFDGVPLIARVREGTVAVAAEGGAGACFLVYADVPSWRWTTIPSPLLSGDEESHVLKLAAEYDLHDGRAPLAFLLRGVAATLVAHVLDKRDGLPHSPERHEQAKFRLTLHQREVEVIGFHSAAHRGIFTPVDSNIHMHFRTIDGQTSGHVERLDLAPGWALGLPAFELGVTTRDKGDSRMKLSARNQLKGRVVEVQKGTTTAHVRIDLGHGLVVVASITNEAVDDLRLAAGDTAWAVIKASDVMVAKE